MFGRKSEWRALRDEHRSIVEEIENGKPIEARHAQPASVDQEGFESCITDFDREAFAKTRSFGVALNRSLAWGRWRVQERNSPLLRLFEDPAFGRTFDLFYNAHLTGRVYLYASPFSGPSSNPKELILSVWVEVKNAQFFPYSDLRSLLRTLRRFIGSE